MTWETIDGAYLIYQVNTFKIDNAMVYQIFSKVFTDTDSYVYLKQRKSKQDSQAVYFDIHKHFVGPNHVAGRLQKQKESCKTHIIMVREKHGTRTIMLPPTKKSMPSWRALQIMVIKVWTMAPGSATFSKE